MRKTIKISTVFLLLTLQAFFITIKYINFIDNFRYFSIIIVGIYLIININTISKKQLLKKDAPFLIFLFFIVFSSFLSKDNSVLLSSIVYVLKTIELVLMLQIHSIKNSKESTIKIIYKFLLFYIIFNDVIAFFIPSLYDTGRLMLLGDKFYVSYYHILLFILYGMINDLKIAKNMIYMVIQIILAIVMTTFVECYTGIIGIILTLFILVVPQKIKNILKNEKIICFTLILFSAILLTYNKILDNNYIRYFIENMLHKDLGLNGRMEIYSRVFEVINRKRYFGYGYNQSYGILTYSIGAVNAQNGILNNVVNYGWIGTIFLIFLIQKIIKQIKDIDKCYYLITYLYMFFILSSIEITLEYIFINVLAICSIYCITNSRKDDKDKNEGVIGKKRSI